MINQESDDVEAQKKKESVKYKSAKGNKTELKRGHAGIPSNVKVQRNRGGGRSKVKKINKPKQKRVLQERNGE